MNRRSFLLGVCVSAAVTLACAGAASASSGDAVAATVPPLTQVAALQGPALPTQRLRVVVHLAYPNQAAVDAFASAVNDPTSNQFGAFLTPDQFDANFAPSQVAYNAVLATLQGAGFTILNTYPDRKVVDAVGTVAGADALFNTSIDLYTYNGGAYYANATPASVPAALRGVVIAVSGLNDMRKLSNPLLARLDTPLTTPNGYGPLDIQTAYNEPIHVNPRLNGTGATIAIETAWDYLDSDIAGYWSAFGIVRSGYLLRQFVDNPVSVGVPTPEQNSETTADAEQTTSNAPGANVLVFEGRDNQTSTFDDVYARVVNDPRVDVVTTSWGTCEVAADPHEVRAANDLFEQGAAEGQTMFAAAGDNGAADCGTNNPPNGLPGQPNPINADFPASSPWVAGGGGSTLLINADRTYKSETAWSFSCVIANQQCSGTGGGVSQFFALPKYQKYASVASTALRNVPDVALNADITTPYALFWNANWFPGVGGTSLVGPNMAPMYAQFAQFYGARLGLAQNALYAGFRRKLYPGTAWHDIMVGNNGYYPAHAGYDNTTGVGSINGYNFMRLMPRLVGRRAL